MNYNDYTFPIDLATNGIPFGAKCPSEKCKYNTNLLCVTIFEISNLNAACCVYANTGCTHTHLYMLCVCQLCVC